MNIILTVLFLIINCLYIPIHKVVRIHKDTKAIECIYILSSNTAMPIPIKPIIPTKPVIINGSEDRFLYIISRCKYRICKIKGNIIANNINRLSNTFLIIDN